MRKIIIFILVLVLSICVSCYFIFIEKNDNYSIYDIDHVFENNSYEVGTLKILSTEFEEVLVQTSDNTFFLNHDINGDFSNIGSVFLDYRNKLTDRKLLVYGHNSKTINEAPFHFLENYLNYDFSKKYNKLLLSVGSDRFYYQLFTVIVVIDDFQHINLNWSDSGYENHVNWLLDNSMFDYSIDVSSHDNIIIFQTCFYEPENSYLLVGWKKIS